MKKDSRLSRLAKNVLKQSIKLQPGEKVFIEHDGLQSLPLLEEFVKEIVLMGGVPFYLFNSPFLQNSVVDFSTNEQMVAYGQMYKEIMEKMDAYISVRGADNPLFQKLISAEKKKSYNINFMQPVHMETRLQKKWCVMRYPTDVYAFSAKMSTEEFENFYFEACLLDYEKLGNAMDALVALMEKTDRVRIVGNGTDLSFSIKGMPAVKCNGGRNIPDGEVYTAPVKDSINGKVQFNTISVFGGVNYSNIYLEFENGKIVKAHSEVNDEKFQEVLNTDEGSKFMGEFAFGVNPFIQKPIGEILFDEKISGSFHMAIGNSYDEAPNGNKSAVHWDLIQIQTKEWGGGSIFLDGVEVRRDGRFILKELRCLNPENLI